MQKPLFPKFKEIHPAWSHKHTQIVMHTKCKVNLLSCLRIPNSYAFMIVNASKNSLGIIPKQHLESSPKQLVRFHSRIWTELQI